MGLQCGGKVPQNLMACIWIFVQQSHRPGPRSNGRRPIPRGERRIHLTVPPWQMACEQVIDGPFAEDGTDFTSYATGAPARLPLYDCCRVVVAGHADYACARADRSQ